MTAPRDLPLRDVLDWQAFSASRYPASRRHDLRALVAYGEYRRLHAVAGVPRVRTAGGENGSAALDSGENEGGPGST